jgi:hypothetical protein
MACFLKVRDGTPVFIAVRCIAATRAAGTVYEQINQSIKYSQDKYSQDKYSQDKYSQDKYSQDKQSQDKQSQDKQSQDKQSQDKQSQDRVDSRKDLIRKSSLS